MNQSFFYVLGKARLILKKIRKIIFSKLFWKELWRENKEILFPNLNPETKVKQLLLSMFAWSIILCPTTVPIANVCVFLADLAGKGTLTAAFWLLTGMLAVSAGFLGSLFILIFISSSVIWFIFTKIKSGKGNRVS